MKIKVETLEEVLGEIETEERFEIILPFLKKISELEEKNEALEEKNKELGKFEGTELINENLSKENLLENIHYLENKIDFLNDENEDLEEINVRIQNKISKLRNIFKSIEKGITLETLYTKIKEIGDLLNSDLSEQIELIKTINEGFREGQKEIKTLRCDKERIEIQWVQLQKIKSEIEEQWKFLQRENERKDNIIKSMEKNSTDLLMSNENLREKISNLEDTNRKLSGELINRIEEIHMLEEEIDRLKSANEDLKRLNRQIQENVK